MKRQKMSSHCGEILTSKKVMKRLSVQENVGRPKTSASGKKGKIKSKQKRQSKTYDDSDTDDLEVMDSGDSSGCETEDLFQSSDEESLPEELDPTKVDLQLESYYAVFYDLNWYIGRVIDFPDEGLCKIKFLKKVIEGYHWPPHEDVQTVTSEFVFYGPINLKGNGPFQVSRGDISKIHEVYVKMKKTFK